MTESDWSAAEWSAFAAILTSIATLILVIVTLYYASQTRLLVRKSDEALEASLRALVSVSYDLRGAMLVLCVRNHGQRTARNLNFEVTVPGDPDALQAIGWPRLKDFFPNEIGLLPPNGAVFHDASYVAGVKTWEAGHPNERLIVPVRISYHDGFRGRTEDLALRPQDATANDVLGMTGQVEMDTGRRIALALERLAIEARRAASTRQGP